MVKRIWNDDNYEVTEAVQTILDRFACDMEADSGMLDYRDWCAIRQVAWALGVLEGEIEDLVNAQTQKHTGEYKTISLIDWRSGLPRTWDKPIYRNLDWPDPSLSLTDAPELDEDKI